MTDKDPLPSEPVSETAESEYSLKRLVRVMEYKNIPGECPMCRTDIWHNASSEEFSHYVPTVVLTTGLSVMVLVCDNCGFVRMHSTRLLRQIDNNIPRKEDSNQSEVL